jgi:hypothetical protein
MATEVTRTLRLADGNQIPLLELGVWQVENSRSATTRVELVRVAREYETA